MLEINPQVQTDIIQRQETSEIKNMDQSIVNIQFIWVGISIFQNVPTDTPSSLETGHRVWY